MGPNVPVDRCDAPTGSAGTSVSADPPENPDIQLGPDGEPLDPRQIDPQSLEANQNASLWVVSGAVLASVAATLVWSATVGASALAVFLASCAVARAVIRGPGPVALVVRRRSVDVVVLTGLAVAIGVLARLLP